MDLQRITFRLNCTAPLAGVAASYGWGPIAITTENIHDFAGYACQDVALLNLLAASSAFLCTSTLHILMSCKAEPNMKQHVPLLAHRSWT